MAFVALLVVSSCGGASNKTSAKSAPATPASTTTTRRVDVAGTCQRARAAAVDVNDALRNVVGNEADAYNHGVDIAKAIVANNAAALATQQTALKVHTDKVASLEAVLAAAKSEKAKLVSACRSALAGKKLSAPCEAVFTAADHEITHITETNTATQAALTAQRDAIAALQSKNQPAARAAQLEANRQTTAANNATAPAEEAFQQVESALRACSGAPAATTTTAASVTGQPGAELQRLASSFGCTGLQRVAAKPDALETGSCTYRGQPFLISTYAASSSVDVSIRALAYCTSDNMATTATSATWLVASQTQDGSRLVIDIATQLGGQVTLGMC